MKKYSTAVLTVLLFSCVTASNMTVGNTQYLPMLADEEEWALAGISADGKTVDIDREQLGVFRDAFTLRVATTDDPNRYAFSGKAAPNRFMMPVTVGENGELTASPPAATLMAAFEEPDVLKEREYLQYLENIKSVALSDGCLVLETADGDGQSVFLTFVPFASEK
jgi:heat shock protein HslJ